jgi:hypothetical protein
MKNLKNRRVSNKVHISYIDPFNGFYRVEIVTPQELNLIQQLIEVKILNHN